jgi:hypothetical protein
MERGMVLIPGAFQGAWAPLLNYAWMAGTARGARSVHVEWPPPIPEFTAASQVGAWVTSHVGQALDRLGADQSVLVGKSLGAYAVGLAADRDLPAIWLTPHLDQDWVVAELRRAGAPFLLIGGTGDGVWRGDLARTLTPHVLEIPGADHGMILSGEPLAQSAHVLGEVVTAIEEFLDDVVWTKPADAAAD